MDVKEFLSRPLMIKRKIRYLELELERYHQQMFSVSSPNYDSVRVDKTPSNNTPNQRALEKYYETEEKIKVQKVELEKVTEEATQTIDKLENEDYKLLLRYHYIDGISITEIADKLYINVRTAQRWHRNSLEMLK